jgi:hypothetical protein
MRPKGKLFALFAVFAAIGLVTASGAFTTVTAERTADVSTAGDASALLAIQPEPGPNGQEYATTNNDQVVEIQLINDTAGSSGVNVNATTEVDNIINITNQGSQDVGVYITRSDEGGNEQLVTFYADSSYSNNMTGISGNAETLSPGESVTVSMEIDTTGGSISNDQTLLSEITIVAEQSAAS